MLALKGNQSSLQEDMQRLSRQALDGDLAGPGQDRHETEERGHGRYERRGCYVVEIPRDHPQRRAWKDLRTLAIVTSGREIGGTETWETRLYVSSHAPRAKPLARAIRKHWSIENSQHWSLDVMFGEDSRRQQDRQGASNLAAVRRLTVSLLRQEQTLKRGAKCKRMACAIDPNYLLRVLHSAKIGA